MGAPEFFDRFDRSAFRLEVYDDYPIDRAVLVSWLRGEPFSPAEQERREWWLSGLRAAHALRRRVYRVHVVRRLPLTTYLQFEFDMQRGNVAAGEEILVARADQHPELAGLALDFWLFDDQVVQPVLLDPEAAPEGISLADARRMRDLALAHAVPLDAFLAELGEPVGAASG